MLTIAIYLLALALFVAVLDARWVRRRRGDDPEVREASSELRAARARSNGRPPSRRWPPQASA